MAAATAAAAARTTRPCPRKAGGAGRTRTVALRAELRSNVCTGLATGQAEVPSLWWSASFNMSLIVVVASRPSDAMPRDVSSLDWTGYIQIYSCHALSESEKKIFGELLNYHPNFQLFRPDGNDGLFIYCTVYDFFP